MKELECIQNNNNGEKPDTTKMIITVKNVTNSKEVLQKTKEVMKCVSQFAYTNTWPEDEKWKEILPQWFVESMTSKSSEDRDNDDYQWHFESWIESMYHRAWEWYSCKIEGDNIIITLKMLNIPYIFEQFLYIFYSQGIEMSNITSEDDIYGQTQH